MRVEGGDIRVQYLLARHLALPKLNDMEKSQMIKLFVARTATLTLVYSILTASAFAQGDLEVDARYVNPSTMTDGSPVPPAFSIDEVIAEIRCQQGDGVADKIADDMIGPGANIGFGEMVAASGAEGVHDSDTILVNSMGWKGIDNFVPEASIQEVAGVVAHEYEHIENARAAGTSTDPTTKGNCGPSAHARMHFEQALARLCGGGSCAGGDDDLGDWCDAILNQLAAGEGAEDEDESGASECGDDKQRSEDAKDLIAAKIDELCL